MGEVVHVVFARKPSVEQPHPARVVHLRPARQEAAGLFYRAGMLDEDPVTYGDAEILYRRGLELDPTDPTALANLAMVLYRTNRHEEAVVLWRESIRSRSDDYVPYFNLGHAFIRKGWYRAAARYLSFALRYGPDVPDVHYMLGVVYDQLAKHKQALEHWDRLLILDPKSIYDVRERRLRSRAALMSQQAQKKTQRSRAIR